ncbi:3-phenylpropionate/trans-cinnamate dioxygenase ferredoxin subunit [Sphingopyxis sp. YR583]|uniref:Rieske (2Fe-2S) protein n=1 Tax=Sphingopyxis sp. YR583 TaxID=1881047 RepID=UPI0008A76F6E|nr:Rieske 2Fe-2S domain-containing protein [Sphingopyxis sp. YR583]SEH19209.1 3-phenylpropionate/trans-cinnamate dioxygenase ferredoxin subunit [Sphingopyxis sp. YR583]
MKLCATADVRPGKSQLIEIAGRSLLLCHTAGGFSLIENRCTHKALPLEGGRLIGNEIICPHHGARFCLTDGRAIAGAIRPLKIYEIAVTSGEISARVPAEWDEAPTG